MVNFFKNKRIFLTGHTGFKGTWLCQILSLLEAEVLGYSLKPETSPNLFDLLEIQKLLQIKTVFGDIRDLENLQKEMNAFKPEIVIHMAAQPLVRDSYDNPVYTYETNVMGTVNILEAIRHCSSVKSVLNVTTDKVYENKEWAWGYRENEPLDGYDPYSNSKSCSELATHSYKRSFLKEKGIALSTARAGNVIGGGDFAKDRIIPDCVRAVQNKEAIILRNPHSIRPYQHVLEPLFAYLTIIKKQYNNPELADYYNVGPNEEDCISTGNLVDLFCNAWGKDLTWENQRDLDKINNKDNEHNKTKEKNKSNEKETPTPHEANFLKLDCSKIKTTLNWKPQWNIDTAIEKTVTWTKVYHEDKDSSPKDLKAITNHQISEFIQGVNPC